MQGLKSAILAIFQNGLGWLCPFSAAPKNPLPLFWVPITPYKDWKVKLERAYFSKVQSGKITVLHGCTIINFSKILTVPSKLP